jgi:hypothetical protein
MYYRVAQTEFWQLTIRSFGQSWRCLSAPDFAPEWKRTMQNLFEPVPVIKQFPWIAQLMSALPKSALAKINPDMAMFQGAKDVRLFPPDHIRFFRD